MENCNECKFISVTEAQQFYTREPHICLKLGFRLFHRSSSNPKIAHDFIYPCEECKGKFFEKVQ